MAIGLLLLFGAILRKLEVLGRLSESWGRVLTSIRERGSVCCDSAEKRKKCTKA